MDVDVLVVGYGPVGAALAGLLGGYGVRTLVIDKAKEIFTAPRAIALDNEALRILQLIGLEEGAFARKPIPYVALRSPSFGEYARIDTAREIDGHPMLVTFFQPELEQALRANVAKHASVTTRLGVTLRSLEEHAHEVSATLSDADGAQHVVRARYVVGADGASSSVRGYIGESFVGESYAEDWLIVDALDVPDTIDHVEFRCDPARPGPHMVAPGGRTRWEFMLRPGEARDAMLADTTIAALLRPWAAEGTYRIERKAIYRFHARACARFSKGRVLLVGDAAHITPPFAGQGLVAGLRDAANLAWKLAWVVGGRASHAILDSYDEERRPHAAKMIDLARFAGLLIMPRSRARAWLTHGAIKLLRRFPPFRSLVDDFGMKPANAYPKGLFVRGRSRFVRGAWLAQGKLRSGAEDVQSDDVLGHGFTLLCSGAPALGAETSRLWERVGGSIVSVRPRGSDLTPGGVEDIDSTFTKLTERAWCVVVRPDRTILHDGPIADADRIVRDALALLGSADPSGQPS